MSNMRTHIKFINHSSVIIAASDIRILCDPWFEGDAFHKGWNLIYENDPKDIENILDNITHLWISHEHPDHFSVRFFLKYRELLKRKKITVLFQSTRDRRVSTFLSSKGILLQDLEHGQKKELGISGVSVTCYQDGFYDSALLFEYGGEKVLNLNDCEISTLDRANIMVQLTGEVDILLTQFSYAAWKGGSENKQWRQESAALKLQTMSIQINAFKPRFVIPFASFIFFSNQLNRYLNDSINTPEKVQNTLLNTQAQIVIMKPYDCFKGYYDQHAQDAALIFWKSHYDQIHNKTFHKYSSVSFDELVISYALYRNRLKISNQFWFMRFLRFISPISVLKPVILHVHDLNITMTMNLFSDKLVPSTKKADLSLHSESLNFLFNNSFGFDTLTVNGCFEEVTPGGFIRATKTLAIENLNNLGFRLSPAILFNFSIIKIFIGKILRVKKSLALKTQ